MAGWFAVFWCAASGLCGGAAALFPTAGGEG